MLEFFTAMITVNVEAGSIVTCTKGAVTQTETSTGSVIFTVGEAGTYTITAEKDGQETSGTVQASISGQTKTLSLAYVRMYGVSWDGFSTTKPSQMDDAGLFAAPTPAVGIGAGFSPFDNCYPWNGMTKVTDGKTTVQYRSIENLWGNVCEWRDGIIFSDENICTYNNPADFKNTYNGAGAAIRSNKWTNAYGYISAWGYDPNDASFICPSTVDGSNTTYVPDYCERGVGVRSFVSGGFIYSGDMAGPFNFSANFKPEHIIRTAREGEFYYEWYELESILVETDYTPPLVASLKESLGPPGTVRGRA